MIKGLARYFYRRKYTRAAITFIRMIFFVKLSKKMKITDKKLDHVSENTLLSNKRRVVADPELPSHPTARNLFGLDLDVVGGKSQRFLDFLKLYDDKLEDKKVLIIGPRNEAEIFTFAGSGLDTKNIIAVDLFTYSPKIQVMDMHELEFGNGIFDVVYAGWVISYSEKRSLAISEMMRVLKPGGLVGVTATLAKASNDDLIAKRGYMIGSKDRIQDVDSLVDLFQDQGHAGKVVFRSTSKEFAVSTAGMVCYEKNF